MKSSYYIKVRIRSLFNFFLSVENFEYAYNVLVKPIPHSFLLFSLSITALLLLNLVGHCDISG